jgi:hypothetical protein
VGKVATWAFTYKVGIVGTEQLIVSKQTTPTNLPPSPPSLLPSSTLPLRVLLSLPTSFWVLPTGPSRAQPIQVCPRIRVSASYQPSSLWPNSAQPAAGTDRTSATIVEAQAAPVAKAVRSSATSVRALARSPTTINSEYGLLLLSKPKIGIRGTS